MIDRVAKVRVLLGVSVVLIMVSLFGVGCGQSSDQSQALEAQKQENEELRKRVEAQEEEQQEAERQQEAQEREDLQQENEELREELEAQKEESEPQETNPPEQESDSPEVVIETAPPSEAPQGVVVVSPDYDVQAVSADEAQALNAAINYYQAVETGDYYTTHSLLSVADQALYPVDTWVAANTNLDSAAGEFVVTDAYPDDVGNNSPTYAVTVAVYLPDGSSSLRTTNFTNEGNGYWAHWLTDEEMALFNGAL